MDNDQKINEEAYRKWKTVTGGARYVAFVDGDEVDRGQNFSTVSTNASELRAQRGPGAVLSIFDNSSGASTPS